MPSRAITKVSARYSSYRLLALGLVLASGCLGGPLEPGADEPLGPEAEVASAEQALFRGSGSPGLGYTCTNGVCECDKAIENDCEDMSAECTDASLDDLIRCIDGWLTTHCLCTQVKTAPKPVWTTTTPVFGGATLLKAR